LRYREDDFIDIPNTRPTRTRSRLTLIGQKREGKFENEVLLSRSRFLAPAANSLRFYREYFTPRSEVMIEKDRLRWFIKYKDTEFYVNLDNVITPPLGYFLELKSRTWSRKDADNKSLMLNELLELLGTAGRAAETVTEDYIDIVEHLPRSHTTTGTT
jgi:5-methylthioadenosine/S-adenosylhomocysteine deaminase